MKKIKPFSGWLTENREAARLIDLGLADPVEIVEDHLGRIATGTNWPVEGWTNSGLDDSGDDGVSVTLSWIRAKIAVPRRGEGDALALWHDKFVEALSFGVYPDGKVLLILDDMGQQVPWRRLNTPAEMDRILHQEIWTPVEWSRVETVDWTLLWQDALKLWNDGHL